MQPQFEIHDYTDKSIVVRVNPEDFLRNYSGHLVNLNGKWNPGLDYPVKGGSSKRGGWIFSKKNEPQVRQLLQMILTGQVPQASPSFTQTLAPEAAPYNPTPTPSIAPSASFLAAAAATASPQPQSLLTRVAPSPAPSLPPTIPRPPDGLPTLIAPSTINPLTPVMGLPGGAPAGYQQIICTVLRPAAGATLHLNVSGQKIPLTVESVTSEEGIVNRAVVTLPDGQRTMIELNLTGMPRWEVPGFTQAHEITM
uniref:Uncharacterized protein n=1 Tax=viral metagenome TaxID=1070528 RepID=A0A6C0IZG3_9ZZZZ